MGRVTGRAVPFEIAGRREGDPPALYARADKIRRELGWAPRWVRLDDIVHTAYGWARTPRY